MDFARGVAIILVLYRHVFEGIKSSGINVEGSMYLEHMNILFYSFRMPLFFIVSGIFLSASFAKRGMSKYIESRARAILFPYFLWGALQITIQILFAEYVNHPPDIFSYLYLFYEPRQIEQFWYLYALFNVSVVYVFMKYLMKLRSWHHVVLGLLLFYLSALSYQLHISLGFVNDILHYYLFIALGDMIHKSIMKPRNIQFLESWKMFFILLIPFALSQSYFLIENLKYPESKYRHVEYYQPYFFILISLIGCAFISSICFLLQRYHRPEWLRVLGLHSLYIYVAHVIAFASVRTIMIRLFHIDNVMVLLISGIISGLLIPVWLYKMSFKFNLQWVFSLDKKHMPKKGKWIDLGPLDIRKWKTKNIKNG